MLVGIVGDIPSFLWFLWYNVFGYCMPSYCDEIGTVDFLVDDIFAWRDATSINPLESRKRVLPFLWTV